MAAGTHQILLPWDNATVFRRNLEAYTQGQYASWTAWTAPTTMSVSAIAQQVGMSEADLRSVNNIPPRMLIKAGSALVVPRSAKMDDVTGQVADHAQLSFSPEIVNRKAVIKAGKRDTVASIAARYKLSAASVADWNDVKTSAAFKAGQAVTVYLPVGVRRVAASAGASGAVGKGQARATAKSVQKVSRNAPEKVVRKPRKK